jgi:hypothetical protein
MSKPRKPTTASPRVRAPAHVERRKKSLDEQLKELDAVIDAAKGKESYTPAVQALAKRAETQAELDRIASVAAIMAEPDELARLAAAARLAMQEGSHTAAANYLRTAEDIRRGREEAERKADPWAGLTEEEVLTKLHDAAAQMPDAHLRVFAEEASRRGLALRLVE